jgi:DNA repair exonuclease SbcCD ATPase subunit
MRIAGVRLTNFGRFRGDHELDLAAGVHAIVARAETDPRRSNWSGKTTFLSAIRWALYGATGDAWKTQDAVISNGEKEGGVDVELTDGTFVSRVKRRGQSAQLKVIVRAADGTERELAQDQAQAAIVERLGMGLVDFDATVWMGQKSMARLIREDPAERTRIVVNWLNLGPLEVAADIVAKKLTDTERTQVGAKAELAAALVACVADRANLLRDVEASSIVVARYRETIAANKTATETLTKWRGDAKLVDAHRDALKSVKTLEDAQPDPIDTTLLETMRVRLVELQKAATDARAEVSRLTKLQAGEFDGICPVTCAECPVRDDVVGARSDIARALVAARETATKADQAWERHRTRFGEVAESNRKWLAWSDSLKRAIGTADALKAQCPTTPLGPEPVVAIDPDLETAVRTNADALSALRAYDAAKATADRLTGEVARRDRVIAVQQTALRILGKGGAQRRIATRSLASIEHIANDLLNRADVGMHVGIDYGRELQDIAAVCPCGRAFPRSAAIKACEQCGAPRGKKRDEKLYINLSTVSGAAEDLAGIAIQLAAARWRRAARGSRWSVVALDEPFGAMDAYNRRALAATLATLAGDGFEQAFVVAHSDDVLEAIPNRLVITASGDWSTIGVG